MVLIDASSSANTWITWYILTLTNTYILGKISSVLLTMCRCSFMIYTVVSYCVLTKKLRNLLKQKLKGLTLLTFTNNSWPHLLRFLRQGAFIKMLSCHHNTNFESSYKCKVGLGSGSVLTVQSETIQSSPVLSPQFSPKSIQHDTIQSWMQFIPKKFSPIKFSPKQLSPEIIYTM